MENSKLPAFAHNNPKMAEKVGYGVSESEHKRYTSGLTKHELACIKLGVPETGDPELDSIIRKSERKKIAAMAMQGILACPNIVISDEEICRASVSLADTLLKELDK